MSLFSHRRSQAAARWLGLVLGGIALSLRLLLPPPAAIEVGAPASGRDLVALFGEHALCVAAALGDAPAPATPQQPASAHHDCLACCTWHAGFGLGPPPSFSIARFAPSETATTRPSADLGEKQPYRIGPLGPRAPPTQA